ncbi:MAG: hypothetical protein J6T28_09715 [Paludibacteraceae bacterium]|nr:hypothetical protein [Paludibacteraceae bacterium]
MEHQFNLGGRLLGKKSVAITFLGLLGPLSLSAEKLDTTFVLDMVVDTTPCYYTKYDSTGNITATGRYTPSDYFRINTGYVTDEEGRKVDTLIYACDKVTRQWNKIEIAHKDSFYKNGMLWFKDYKVSYSSAHPYYMPDSLGTQYYKSSETFFSYSMSGYYKENRLLYSTDADAHGSHIEYTDRHIVYRYDSYGNLKSYENTEDITPGQLYPALYDTYKNEYDDNHNLVSYILESNDCGSLSIEEKVSYVYDEYNRRVKEIRYLPVDPYSDSIEWRFQDSTVYLYEGAPLTRPHISSLIVDEESVTSFDENLYDYWFDMEYNPDIVSYELPAGVTATESFDDSTNILTIRLTSNSTNETVEYKFHFRPTDGVDDFLGDQVSIYVMDKTICVDGAEEPLFVYDLLGALVGTGRGEAVRIPVPQAGVYVVRAGGKAKKVVVR